MKYQEKRSVMPSMLDVVLKKRQNASTVANTSSGKIIDSQELVANLKQELRLLVEKIMHPETPDEERFKLGAIYEEKLKAYVALGGKGGSWFGRDGLWHED